MVCHVWALVFVGLPPENFNTVNFRAFLLETNSTGAQMRTLCVPLERLPHESVCVRFKEYSTVEAVMAVKADLTLRGKRIDVKVPLWSLDHWSFF